MIALLAAAAIVVSVHDGDTLRLADGTRVRLAGIDANELDGRCHTVCAPRSAADARDRLAALALGRRVVLEPVGTSYDRVVAWVRLDGRDLSCELVRGGYAIIWRRYDPGHRLAGCAR